MFRGGFRVHFRHQCFAQQIVVGLCRDRFWDGLPLFGAASLFGFFFFGFGSRIGPRWFFTTVMRAQYFGQFDVGIFRNDEFQH